MLIGTVMATLGNKFFRRSILIAVCLIPLAFSVRLAITSFNEYQDKKAYQASAACMPSAPSDNCRTDKPAIVTAVVPGGRYSPEEVHIRGQGIDQATILYESGHLRPVVGLGVIAEYWHGRLVALRANDNTVLYGQNSAIWSAGNDLTGAIVLFVFFALIASIAIASIVASRKRNQAS